MSGPHRPATAARRRALGPLTQNRVAPRTLKRYKQAVAMFLSYLTASGCQWAADWEALDQQLCDFIENLWLDGESRGWAADALSGTQLLLRVQHKFDGAWGRL